MTSGKKQLMVEENGTAELVQSVWELYGWKIVAKRVNLIREMECLMVVGLWCAHPDPKSRPSMKQAISALNFEVPLPELPPTMPVPTYSPTLSMPTYSFTSDAQVNSINGTRLSLTGGR
ncbi:hypothetical protein ZIOFF_025712 [Zingiber officinale]|uniref:Uncharacterized protein n=1 Tax=Zingiber officinale TaxID=94328 RepID=A0A8J5GWB3_ZINOF|nr:hypothetical protein ZIOFF_025712 [Zingiber officinale]